MHAIGGGSFVGVGVHRTYVGLASDLVKACAEAIRACMRQGQSSRQDLVAGAGRGPLVVVLRGTGYAESTAKKYAAIAATFASEMGGSRLEELRDDDVIAYLQTLGQEGLGDAGLRVALCALRAVFDRVLGMGITADIRHAPRPAPRPAASKEEVAALLSSGLTLRTWLLVYLLNTTKRMPGKLRKLFPSRNRPGAAISDRTVRRIVERACTACGFHTTCTQIRKADLVPLDMLV